MTAVAVLEAVSVGHASVAEKDHKLVNRLGRRRKEVPEHVGILEMRLRVSLLSVDEMRELCRVANEEDRRVVENPVPVALLGAQLDREATRVARRVGGTALATDRREASGRLRLVTHFGEQLGARDVGEVIGHFEGAVSAGALCAAAASVTRHWDEKLKRTGPHALAHAPGQSERASRCLQAGGQ